MTEDQRVPTAHLLSHVEVSFNQSGGSGLEVSLRALLTWACEILAGQEWSRAGALWSLCLPVHPSLPEKVWLVAGAGSIRCIWVWG